MTDRRRRNELLKKLVAAVALVACMGIGVVIVATVWPQILSVGQRHAETTQTSRPPAAPVENIRPLPVRPVQELLAADQCPPEGQTPEVAPSEVFTACDFERTGAYVLGPQAMEVDLTHVETRKSPTTEFYVVQMVIRPSSKEAFASYTASHVDGQVAFVRDGIVLFAPKIAEKIDSEALEISGNLTAEQAEEIARLLRQPP